MDTTVIVAIIAAIPPTLAALMSILQNRKNHIANTEALEKVTTKLEEAHEVANTNRAMQQDNAAELTRELIALKTSLEKYRTL